VTVFLAAATAAGAGLATWPVAVTALLSVLAAGAPGSAAPLVLVLWLGGYWMLGVEGATVVVWVVCAILARGGPPGGRLVSGAALAVVAAVVAVGARRTGSVR
jgi:hypothetical protein